MFLLSSNVVTEKKGSLPPGHQDPKHAKSITGFVILRVFAS